MAIVFVFWAVWRDGAKRWVAVKVRVGCNFVFDLLRNFSQNFHQLEQRMIKPVEGQSRRFFMNLPNNFDMQHSAPLLGPLSVHSWFAIPFCWLSLRKVRNPFNGAVLAVKAEAVNQLEDLSTDHGPSAHDFSYKTDNRSRPRLLCPFVQLQTPRG